MEEKNQDGSGKPLTEASPPDFAETLVMRLRGYAFKFGQHGSLADLVECNDAERDLLQALRAPKGDELTVLDRFAMAMMPIYFGKLEIRFDSVKPLEYRQAAEHCFRDADAMLVERSRREAQP
jgi:hypothetical protein